MTQLPNWIADTAIALSGNRLHEAEVTGVEHLSEQIRLVRFRGDRETAAFRPGQELLFPVDSRHFRHYTVAGCVPGEGVCSMILRLHGAAPGSDWAARLHVGDPVRLKAIRGKIEYDSQASHHFFFGDETAIGLFDGYRQLAQAADKEYFGVLELYGPNEAALTRLGLMLDTVNAAPDQPAVGAISWMEQMHPYCWNTWRHATYYLAGRALSVQRMFRYLLDRGVQPGQIRKAVYWADGETGL